jgi:hypothetical protein
MHPHLHYLDATELDQVECAAIVVAHPQFGALQ